MIVHCSACDYFVKMEKLATAYFSFCSKFVSIVIVYFASIHVPRLLNMFLSFMSMWP